MTAPISTPTTVRWATPVHRTGAALLGAVGLLHLLVAHVFAGAGSPAEAAVDELSARTTVTMFDGGRRLTVFGLDTGYSVGMGLLGLLFGTLMLVAVRAAPQLITRWSLFNWVCAVTAGGVFWIACLYFPEPVIAVSGIATVCFAAVLIAGEPARG